MSINFYFKSASIHFLLNLTDISTCLKKKPSLSVTSMFTCFSNRRFHRWCICFRFRFASWQTTRSLWY